LFLLGIGYFLSFSASAQNVAQGWKNFSFVERAFYDVALKSEFRKGQTRVLKWKSPIKIWVKHDVGNKKFHERLLQLHIQQLSEITHLSMSFVPKRTDANMLFFFTKQSRWRNIVQKEMGERSAKNTYGSVCMFNLRSNRTTSIIHKAVIVIPVDQARDHGKLIACVIEETTQALGLKNDSELAFPSIFNDKTPDTFLTPLDITLLKLLYSPSIKPGMNEKKLKPLLRQQYRTMQRDGEMNNTLHQAIHAPLKEEFGL